MQYSGDFAPSPTALDSAQPNSFRRDARLIGVVGLAHSISHFFQLALPPLFPLLRAEFGVSYALLGTLVGVFYAASSAALRCLRAERCSRASRPGSDGSFRSSR